MLDFCFVRGVSRAESCRFCNSSKLDDVLNLGKTALANNFLTEQQVNDIESGATKEFKADLIYCLCRSCGLYQIRNQVNPEILFSNYQYASSTSGNLKKHFEDYTNDLIRRFNLNKFSLVIEPASNDGVMLESFKKKNIKCLGVEPSQNLADIANKNGLETISKFFGIETAQEILNTHGKCDVLVVNNAYAHLSDIHDFTDGIKLLLKDNGIFCFENSYLLDIVERNLFDVHYFEHVLQLSILPLKRFFESKQLELFDVLLNNQQGGSIRCCVQHKNGPNKINSIIEHLIVKEINNGLYNILSYENWGKNINKTGNQLKKILSQYKKDGFKIVGYGYPAKSTTLVSYFKIGNIFDYIIEDSLFKIGKFTPQFHVPIRSKEYLYSDNSKKVVVILAWNFCDMILANNKDLKNDWIIPLPEIKIVKT